MRNFPRGLRQVMITTVALCGAMAGTASATTSVTLLGMSGHDDTSSQIANAAASSLKGALSSRFTIIPGEKYKKTAAALGAASAKAEDVATVAAALKLGYVVAGLAEPSNRGHEITVTVRRGADGQVLNKFHYSVPGDALDDDTATKMDNEITSAIADDAEMAPNASPQAAPSPTPNPAAASDGSAAGARTGGSAVHASARRSHPSHVDAIDTSADRDNNRSGAIDNTSDENPLSSVSSGDGASGGGVEGAVGDSSGDTAGEVTEEASPGRSPMIEGAVGASLLTRTFQFDDHNEQQFNGTPAPALHASGAIYPLALGHPSSDRRFINRLGLCGTVDYGTIYGTPMPANLGGGSVQTFQEQFDAGLRYRAALHEDAGSTVVRAGVGYGERVFAIQQTQAVSVPDITLRVVTATAGIDVPLGSVFTVLANVSALVPSGVSVDVAKYGQAAAGVGLGGNAGLAVRPLPWMSFELAFDYLQQNYNFQTRGVAHERYIGATAALGVAY